MSIIYVNLKLSVHTRPLRAKGTLTKPNASCLYPVWDGDECCIVQHVRIQERVVTLRVNLPFPSPESWNGIVPVRA